jgi:SRSO17 transposase
LVTYLDAITGVLKHASRAASAQAYCTGLLRPGERKSIEPMAARLEPAHVQAKHQSLHHLVAQADRDDAAVLAAVRAQVLPTIERHGPMCSWIVDDTGFPKQGKHSVGVARHDCGQLGKQDNWQLAVSLSVANDRASRPIAYRLYLPGGWANDPDRRAKAGGPAGVAFETKTAIALGQRRQALADGVPVGIVRGDPAYGDETDFRVGVAELGLRYRLGVRSGTSVWPPGKTPLPPPSWSGRGRPATRLRRDAEHQPVTLKALASSLPAARAWRSVTWREGTRGKLVSRFAAVGVRPAYRDTQRCKPWPEEWLLMEWPAGDGEPAKDWFSNLPRRMPLRRLVQLAKTRWWVERDYQDLKQERGLGHYEGRNWRGFHHHASLCMAAYGFLIAERCLFPLSSNSSAAGSKHLCYPQASSRGLPPMRPERHVQSSTASIRRLLAVKLVKTLPRCPCCLRQQPQSTHMKMTQ